MVHTAFKQNMLLSLGPPIAVLIALLIVVGLVNSIPLHWAPFAFLKIPRTLKEEAYQTCAHTIRRCDKLESAVQDTTFWVVSIWGFFLLFFLLGVRIFLKRALPKRELVSLGKLQVLTIIHAMIWGAA